MGGTSSFRTIIGWKLLKGMKKTVCVVICLIFLYTILIGNMPVLGISIVKNNSGAPVNNDSIESIQKSISSKLIRFHVIANSDSKEDQNLKLLVRDKVLEYIAPKLKDSKTIEESREILRKNDGSIKEIAQKVVKQNGYNYNVSTTLSMESFPVKAYGSITLPQGKYEAYKILIGNSNGQNWWCVMFPPLCFVDLAKGELAEKETESSMKRVLNDKEYETVNNRPEGRTVVVRFKVLEIVKGIKNKISSHKSAK
jgi:stage II sporulation protein R